MAHIGLQIQTKLQTRLALTPEIKTALELLQLPQIELEQRITEELESNPLLEWDDTKSLKVETDYDAFHREGTDFSKRTDVEDYDRFERLVPKELGLYAHLDWQVHISPWDEDDKDLALELVPMFAADGYLRETNEELATVLSVDTDKVEALRSLFQTLDPPGLATRNLPECLCAQLKERGREDCLAAEIIRHHGGLLEDGRASELPALLDVDQDRIDKALLLLRELNPSPGAKFRDDTSDPIQPELKIEKAQNGQWRVEPYKPWSNRIRRSKVMLKFQHEPESFSKKEMEYLREKIRIAEYFLNSLKQRDLTLLRVAEAILKRQAPLLDIGPESALPLTLKDIAQDVELHESTISRVTRRKYAITPHGILELKAFFRQSIDGQHTPDMIKKQIKDLIDKENPERPLSDQVISNILSKDGTAVARRTVAKYRTELTIPSRAQRRQRL